MIFSEKMQTAKSPIEISKVLFYIGIMIELAVVILDKSAYINPYETWMFRLAFLCFALKICMTKYTAREYGWMLLFGIVAVLCYFSSGRDEAVRITVFCISLKGMEWKKILKVMFWVTAAGCTMLILLSLTGIYGELGRVADYGRGADEMRYSLGLGHPNALSCMVFVLMVLGIALYHEKLKWWHYGLLAVLTILTYVLTVSRTGLLFMAGALVLAVCFQYIPALGEKKWVYILGFAAVAFCVALSFVAAYYGKGDSPFPLLDRVLNGRFRSSFDYTYEGGAMKNWTLFSVPENNIYFDTGYIRLFYWYGIIPGAVYLFLNLAIMWKCMKERNRFWFMLLLLFSCYTLLEAHFISVYIGRNYMLVLMGAWWSEILHADKGKDAYWWQFYKLLPGKGGNA